MNSCLNPSVIPHENDILLGRGGTNNRHIGNQKFRDLAKIFVREYSHACKKSKSKITKNLVDIVHSANPPGRFLRRVQCTHEHWEEVDDNTAKEKAGQALRDARSTKSKQNKTRLKVPKLPSMSSPSHPASDDNTTTMLFTSNNSNRRIDLPKVPSVPESSIGSDCHLLIENISTTNYPNLALNEITLIEPRRSKIDNSLRKLHQTVGQASIQISHNYHYGQVTPPLSHTHYTDQRDIQEVTQVLPRQYPQKKSSGRHHHMEGSKSQQYQNLADKEGFQKLIQLLLPEDERKHEENDFIHPGINFFTEAGHKHGQTQFIVEDVNNLDLKNFEWE